MELWTYEQESWAQGCETVCGVDEAGAHSRRVNH